MASKIETSLNAEEREEFFRRCAQLKGAKLKDIAALAEEFGVEISLMSARSFKRGAFQDYLDELKAKREMAESVADLAKNGVGLSDGAASIFAQKVFDAAIALDPQEIGSKSANNLSLAIARLRAGDQNAARLEAQLKLAQEKLAKLEAEREEREEKKRALLASIEGVKKKGGLTKESLAKIEEAAGLL